MPRPVAFSASIRAFVLAAVAALPVLVWGACSTESGTTPNCVSDVTSDGIKPVENGCSGFATCTDDKGMPADPATVCCADKKDSDLQSCLFLYGKAPAPAGSGSSTGSGSGGGGGGSSSSSSTGSGDAGDNG